VRLRAIHRRESLAVEHRALAKEHRQQRVERNNGEEQAPQENDRNYGLYAARVVLTVADICAPQARERMVENGAEQNVQPKKHAKLSPDVARVAVVGGERTLQDYT